MTSKQYILFVLFVLLVGCTSDRSGYPFTLMTGDQCGVSFENTLETREEMNILEYMYFYNGGGIGAGDFNNDGLIDLYFSGNQVSNKLYLNNGDFQFEDVTDKAFTNSENNWSTGVTVIDINNDGLLDIYVCEVGDYKSLKGKNKLFVCREIINGVPIYDEKSTEYGLDFSGFSTQSAFLDYDLDGDLDMYLLNHSVHENTRYGKRESFKDNYHPLSGDQLFENENGQYRNVTKASGIFSNEIGYGLGIAVSDINVDGYPDIYVGNDFYENDYLYINQKDGSFKEEIDNYLGHTSRFTMGVDIADVNNDGLNDIMTLDMKPFDTEHLKSSEATDEYDIYNYKLSFGYNHQYARNCLQLNNGNGSFSDVAEHAGIDATDWSWSTLLLDFDNDGSRDIFVSNGIPKRMNDIDFIKFISSGELNNSSDRSSQLSRDQKLIDAIPEAKMPNCFFHNTGQLSFEKSKIADDKLSYSNGAVYADLDNDGDLDVVTNNINEAVFFYRNETSVDSNHLIVELIGTSENRNAIGAKVRVMTQGGGEQFAEKFGVRGFQSSMESTLHFGLGNDEVSMVEITWPDNTTQIYTQDAIVGNTLVATYQKGLPLKSKSKESQPSPLTFSDCTSKIYFDVEHKENDILDFNRERLLPYALSTAGPCLDVGDLNGDGLEDFIVGSSKGESLQVFLQTQEHNFRSLEVTAIQDDKNYEDADVLIDDFNDDGLQDILVLSGGNEYQMKSEYYAPRLYLNQDNNTFIRSEDAFRGILCSGSQLCANDYDGDGDLDLFLAAHSMPRSFGKIPQSFLLNSDGFGTFSIASENDLFADLGLIKTCEWIDLDNDGDADLLLGLEWGKVVAYINESGQFKRRNIINEKGLWNCLLPYDFDNDGDLDLLAGNVGTNNSYYSLGNGNFKMYVNDFDDNGSVEQILTYLQDGKEVIFASKASLETQLPYLKKQYLSAKEFAKASPEDLVGMQKLNASQVYEINCLESIIFQNDGNFNFTKKVLPVETQLSPVKVVVPYDVNKDGLMDIVSGGNFYDNSIQLGRHDGAAVQVILNKGDCDFQVQKTANKNLQGQIRSLRKIKIGDQQMILVGSNNERLKILVLKE